MTHCVGIDLGLMADKTAVAIVHLDEEGNVVLDHLEEIDLRGSPHAIAAATEVIRDLNDRYPNQRGAFDLWSGIAFAHSLQKAGMTGLQEFHATKRLTQEMDALVDQYIKPRLSLTPKLRSALGRALWCVS